jgi:hypothetical protein
VQILEHDDDPGAFGQRREAMQERLEQTGLAHLAGYRGRLAGVDTQRGGVDQSQSLTGRGQDRGRGVFVERAGELAEHADHRPVRQTATLCGRAHAGDHDCAGGAGPVRELLDEARLPDAGLAPDQDGARTGRVERVECTAQEVDFGLPARKGRARP